MHRHYLEVRKNVERLGWVVRSAPPDGQRMLIGRARSSSEPRRFEWGYFHIDDLATALAFAAGEVVAARVNEGPSQPSGRFEADSFRERLLDVAPDDFLM